MEPFWLVMASVLIVVVDLGVGWWLKVRLGRQGKPLQGLIVMLVNLLLGIALVMVLWLFLVPVT